MTGTGRFVTIDGPGAVGKSTVCAAVVDELHAAGVDVHKTREPSDTVLGKLARHGTDTFRGMTFACLIAADRYHHVETEVRPAVARGATVVCDRYVASSLVLQVIDGVARDAVWELNRHADMPDLAVILNARADVIEKRLTSRGSHSRYEREPGGTERECGHFREAARFLMATGVRVLQVDAGTAGPEEIARDIVAAINEL
ncbi:dTMP kinase [Streptomyces sp. NPDC053560]|uniref:dTMP kinase n=1 Tax=Streptomyces sp. NPDC053560 TaxID=3365711 RepID=UPI0037CCE4FF